MQLPNIVTAKSYRGVIIMMSEKEIEAVFSQFGLGTREQRQHFRDLANIHRLPVGRQGCASQPAYAIPENENAQLAERSEGNSDTR